MADEQEAIAQVAAETPSEPELETVQPTDLQALAEEDNAAAETVEEPAEEFEEFEWNGKQIKAPKGLKDGVLMHADYTRKTQANAEEKRALSAEREALKQQAKISE